MADIKSGFLPALYQLSLKTSNISLHRFIVAIIAETIYVLNWDALVDTDNVHKIIKRKSRNARGYIVAKEYDRDSLYALIEGEWDIPNYEYLLPKGEKCWAYEYDKTTGMVSIEGFVAKRDSNKAYQVNLKCGNKIYFAIENRGEQMEQGTVTEAPESNPISNTIESHSPEEVDKPKLEPNKFPADKVCAKSAIGGELKRSLESLYDDLVSARDGGDCVKNYEYIWQWKISENEYKRIQETLIADECKKSIEKLYKQNKKVMFLIVAYVAERFKREYRGNDGEDNAITQMGLRSEDIAKLYFGENSPKIFQRPNGHTEWLDSIRIDGGLPIKYIAERQTSAYATFVKKIWKEQREIEDALNSLNNEAIKHSYKNNYSLKKYVDTIISEGLNGVCSESDVKNIDYFKTFYTFFTEERGRAQSKSNKFRYSYRIWRYGDELILHSSIVLRQDSSFNEPQELISRNRIKGWGIEPEPNDLIWLEIEGQKYEFQPWGKQYYRSSIGSVEFPLKTSRAPFCELLTEPTIYIYHNGIKKKVRSIVEKSNKYINFSSNNGHNWVDRAGRELSAVLIKNAKVELEHSEEPLPIGENLRWIEYNDRIKIDGEYKYAKDITIYPTDNAYHAIAKSTYIRNITYGKDDDIKSVLVLDANNIRPENFEIKATGDNQKPKNAEIIKYYNISEKRWIQYPLENPPIGLVRLKIDNETLTDTFILPGDFRIIRECRNESGNITVQGFGDWKVSAEGYNPQPTNRGWSIEDSYNESNVRQDSICIDFNKGGDTLSIEIIRPLNREDKMLHHQIVSAKIKIPKKLAMQYRLRKFDDKGVTYKEDKSSTKQYSNEIKKHRENFCYIANGREIKIEDNLEFVYLSFNEQKFKEQTLTLEDKTIREGGNNILYRCVSDELKGKGIVIQSLQNAMPKITYYKPLWVDATKNEFMKALSALVRFKLSTKHKLYFSELLVKEDFTVTLFFDYCKDCDDNDTPIDWNILWSAANELEFDWLFIPREQWNNVATDDNQKRLVCELFRNRPYFDWDVLVDNYWTLPEREDGRWKRRGQKTEAFKFLRYVFSCENEAPNKLPKKEDIDKELDKILKTL